jgi:hypothetical protein
MERLVTAADCALAIALPLTFAEFAEDAEAPDRDFVRSVLAGSGRGLRDTWAEVYAPKVVQGCERVAAAARAAGTAVIEGATLADLHGLLSAFSVVCLVGHTTQTPIAPADLADSAEILRIIEAGESIVARYLRGRLAGQAISPREVDRLAAFLDDALAETRAWILAPARRERRGRPELHLERVFLEECFRGALRPAPLLELRDGLVTMANLDAAIPPDFAGVLDLSVCNSVAIAELIKRRRRDCLVVHNSFLARLDVRLDRFALAMDILSRRAARYSDVLHSLSLELLRTA